MLLPLVLPGWANLGGRTGSAEEAMILMAFAVAFLSLPAVGVILAILRPGNPIGWLQLVGGIGFAFLGFAPMYVEASLRLDLMLVGYRLVDWLTPTMQNIAWIIVVFYLPLLFPDGRLPSARWRPLALAVTLGTAGMLGSTLVIDRPEWGRLLPIPIQLDAALEAAIRGAAGVLELAPLLFIPLALVAVLTRYRRSEGTERQQMKWFLTAASLVVGASLVAAVNDSLWATFAFLLALVFLPVAIGIAVLRYRLYEIDRIISRTIGWAIMTGLLVGAFSLLVLGSSTLLDPLTGGNTLAVAGSTLVVAALFAPLRSRVQRAVDRQFDRARHDGERLISVLGDRLRDEVDRDAIRGDVTGTVDAAVRPTSVGLWLRR